MPEIASPSASTLTPAKTARQRTDTFTSIWMMIAVAMALATLVAKSRMPQPLWTMIHLVTLDFSVVVVLRALSGALVR